MRVLVLHFECEFLHGGRYLAAMEFDASYVDLEKTTGNLQGVELFGYSDGEVGSAAYEPSMLQTDFSGDLPVHTGDEDLGISAGYNVDAVVGSAWNNLRSEDYKLPWETDFWDQFLDPSVSVMEQMSKGSNVLLLCQFYNLQTVQIQQKSTDGSLPNLFL